MDTAFFPLDRELKLERSGLTPHAHECLVRLGAWMPFVHAAQQLEAMLGVQVSPSTVRRLTEAAGKLCEHLQNAPALPQADQRPTEQANSSTPMAMSADGAMVFVRGRGWQEVKTLVLAEVEPLLPEASPHACQRRTREHTTFSRLSDAETFSDLCSGEISRRGIERAPQVCAIQDGAIWLQGFVDGHRHDAVRILDFYHAAEYVSAIEEEVRALGGHLPMKWLEGVLHRLKHDGPSRVLKHLSWLVERFGPSPTLQSNLSYLLKREEQMQYPLYQAAGWPIGSGMVESAHKRVLQARLKGAGMQWADHNVNAMLALRTMIDNVRWEQEWQERRDFSLQQQHEQACARQSRQQQKAIETLKPLVARFLLLQAHCQLASRALLAAAAPPPSPRRRSAFNPWRGDPSKAFPLQAKK
ncbi:MAG: ISKra4 family transposase [Chloroflexi bacterium]|nr:ISKra4 family transposase [Chloroflexota bacterium]